MTGGRRKLDSYVSLRSWWFVFSFWGQGKSFVVALRSKGWRRGESARLPLLWLGFKSRRQHHMWECGLSLLLVFSFAPRGFSLGIPVFPSPQKSTFPNSNSTRNQVDEEPLCGCATSKSLFIYLFMRVLGIPKDAGGAYAGEVWCRWHFSQC